MREGRETTVRQIRRDFQMTMEESMITLVETALGRRVICLLSDHRPDPDFACEVFVLAPEPRPAGL